MMQKWSYHLIMLQMAHDFSTDISMWFIHEVLQENHVWMAWWSTCLPLMHGLWVRGIKHHPKNCTNCLPA